MKIMMLFLFGAITYYEPEYRAALLAEAEDIKAGMNNLYDVAKIMAL